MFLEPFKGCTRSVCLLETGWVSNLFTHKFFAHASALKHLKAWALVHEEIVIPLYVYLPIKGKNRELQQILSYFSIPMSLLFIYFSMIL